MKNDLSSKIVEDLVMLKARGMKDQKLAVYERAAKANLLFEDAIIDSLMGDYIASLLALDEKRFKDYESLILEELALLPKDLRTTYITNLSDSLGQIDMSIVKKDRTSDVEQRINEFRGKLGNLEQRKEAASLSSDEKKYWKEVSYAARAGKLSDASFFNVTCNIIITEQYSNIKVDFTDLLLYEFLKFDILGSKILEHIEKWKENNPLYGRPEQTNKITYVWEEAAKIKAYPERELQKIFTGTKSPDRLGAYIKFAGDKGLLFKKDTNGYRKNLENLLKFHKNSVLYGSYYQICALRDELAKITDDKERQEIIYDILHIDQPTSDKPHYFKSVMKNLLVYQADKDALLTIMYDDIVKEINSIEQNKKTKHLSKFLNAILQEAMSNGVNPETTIKLNQKDVTFSDLVLIYGSDITKKMYVEAHTPEKKPGEEQDRLPTKLSAKLDDIEKSRPGGMSNGYIPIGLVGLGFAVCMIGIIASFAVVTSFATVPLALSLLYGGLALGVAIPIGGVIAYYKYQANNEVFRDIIPSSDLILQPAKTIECNILEANNKKAVEPAGKEVEVKEPKHHVNPEKGLERGQV